ncbi:MAG: hypothetical protein JW774_11515 [Candidatus Aureabacteria bacterium]|nr:hypothetical protein [Candidatus Auribacterota bacterium]
MPDNYVYVKDEYREKYRTMINEFETTIKENYYRLHRHDSSIYRVITGEDMFINTDEQLEIISDCVDLFEKFILQMREDDFKREYQQRFVTFKSIAEESRQQYNNLKKAVYFWIDTFKDTPKRIEFDRKYATQQSS